MLSRSLARLTKEWLELITGAAFYSDRSFSQSSSLLLHGQLHALRIRHDASLATLLQENDKLRRELSKERKEAERTRARLGQVGEEAWIEAEGRRREIGL